jgi:hypothetical protein
VLPCTQVTVALMFGSGMPLCYLIAVCIFLFTAAVERYALIRLCGIANRYSRQLPDAIIGERQGVRHVCLRHQGHM